MYEYIVCLFSEVYTREFLDEKLSRALNVPLSPEGRLEPIDDCKYVLTLDYTLKMLNVHECHECGIPMVILGETGVGKTALVEMLSTLWMQSWSAIWLKYVDRVMQTIERQLDG